MSLVQKFEETGFVFYNIKGVVGQKRRLAADQTVHLRKQFKEDQGSQFLKFSRLPQQLDIGMEQHTKFSDTISRRILTRYTFFKHWVIIKRLFDKLCVNLLISMKQILVLWRGSGLYMRPIFIWMRLLTNRRRSIWGTENLKLHEHTPYILRNVELLCFLCSWYCGPSIVTGECEIWARSNCGRETDSLSTRTWVWSQWNIFFNKTKHGRYMRALMRTVMETLVISMIE